MAIVASSMGDFTTLLRDVDQFNAAHLIVDPLLKDIRAPAGASPAIDLGPSPGETPSDAAIQQGKSDALFLLAVAGVVGLGGWFLYRSFKKGRRRGRRR